MAIKVLEASGFPPLEDLVLHLGSRLTVITGDNGYGKSFILNLLFWQMSGEWISNFHPIAQKQNSVSLLLDTGGRNPQRIDWNSSAQNSHLVIYARSDGGFSTWDPAAPSNLTNLREDEVWKGNDQFPGIRAILKKILSTEEKSWLSFFQATNPLLNLSAEAINVEQINSIIQAIIPIEPFALVSGSTEGLKFPFGFVSFDHASQATRRLFSLVFMLIKTISEHHYHARKRGFPSPIERVVVLLDEPEAHLHPKWQRTVLPGILENIPNVHAAQNVQFQFVVTTHAPLVLASIEQLFDINADAIYTLDAQTSLRPSVGDYGIPTQPQDPLVVSIVARPFEFEKIGTSDSWLASSVFKVPPMSVESERAIQKAEAIMRAETTNSVSITAATKQLRGNLPADHPFLIQWNFYLKNVGRGKDDASNIAGV